MYVSKSAHVFDIPVGLVPSVLAVEGQHQHRYIVAIVVGLASCYECIADTSCELLPEVELTQENPSANPLRH